MIAIPDTEEIKKADGIGVNIHYEDGHIETYIIGIDEIIEIVTCGECKWFIEQGEGNVGKCKYRTRPMLYCLPTDFCSYGERKSDPNNCKECELADKCDHHICLKAAGERRADEE